MISSADAPASTISRSVGVPVAQTLVRYEYIAMGILKESKKKGRRRIISKHTKTLHTGVEVDEFSTRMSEPRAVPVEGISGAGQVPYGAQHADAAGKGTFIDACFSSNRSGSGSGGGGGSSGAGAGSASSGVYSGVDRGAPGKPLYSGYHSACSLHKL